MLQDLPRAHRETECIREREFLKGHEASVFYTVVDFGVHGGQQGLVRMSRRNHVDKVEEVAAYGEWLVERVSTNYIRIRAKAVDDGAPVVDKRLLHAEVVMVNRSEEAHDVGCEVVLSEDLLKTLRLERNTLLIGLIAVIFHGSRNVKESKERNNENIIEPAEEELRALSQDLLGVKVRHALAAGETGQ